MKQQLIFIYDKKQNAYVDKTSQIIDIRNAGSSVNIDYGSGKIFHYRPANVCCYPLIKTYQPVRIYHNGKLQEQYNTLFDYGEYVKMGTDCKECFIAIKKAEIEVSKIQPLPPGAQDVMNYFTDLLKEVPVAITERSEEPQSESSEGLNSIPEILAHILENIDLQDARTVLQSYLNKKIDTGVIKIDNIIYPFGCNESQKVAVQRALSNNVSVIEGPPGTGKTQTILNIAANLLMQGKTVGIVSNNNAAVDNVREKFSKYGYGALMAELGSKANRQAFFETKRTDFTPEDGWCLKESDQRATSLRLVELSTIIDELFRRENELSTLRTRLTNAECEYRQLQKERPILQEQIQQIDRLFFHRFNSRRALLLRNFIIEKYQANIRLSLFKRAELLFRYGAWHQRELFKRADLLASYVDYKFYRSLIYEITKKIEQLESWLQAHDAKKLNLEYTELSTALLRDKLFRKYEKLEKDKEQPDFSAESYRKNFTKFVERYPILLSTTYSLSGSVGRGHLLDYVIIDESSQVDVITATICCTCCRNIVIIGDSRQLPHIVDSKLTERSFDLRMRYNVPAEYDYVHHNILSSLKQAITENLPVTLLREHYRCHPLIINFCNRKYYRGQLLIMTRSNESTPFQVLTTTDSKTYTNKGRIYNQRQIDATCEWLKDEPTDPTHIGVISPYRYHAEELRKFLPAGIEADTIHKFQGREKDLIIFHTVRQQMTEFLDNPNLINVAVSRAVRRLVVVKTEGMSIIHGSDIGDLLRYIRFTSENDAITFINSRIRSVFDMLHTEYAVLQQTLKLSGNRQSPAEQITDQLLYQILSEQERFSAVGYHKHYRLSELVGQSVSLSDEERSFVEHGAHLDFLLFNRMDNSPILGIEVDGVVYHRFNEMQTARDQKKNHILEVVGLPLLRLSTDGSNEKDRIIHSLEQAMQRNEEYELCV